MNRLRSVSKSPVNSAKAVIENSEITQRLDTVQPTLKGAVNVATSILSQNLGLRTRSAKHVARQQALNVTKESGYAHTERDRKISPKFGGAPSESVKLKKTEATQMDLRCDEEILFDDCS